MANTNFIPWLEGKDQYSALQNQYNNIYKNGFESGNLVKAEDFNAALRMTTLVCAGIASVFGFDNKTIDASEDTITKAIQAANITLGDITANIIISKMGINTPSVTAAQVNASIINATTTITARGALSGLSLNINGTQRIDSSGNIKNISSIDTAGRIRAAGVLEGNSLTINGVERINSDGNITGTLVTVNKASMTHLGFTAGSNLVIDNDSNISANKIISDTSVTANSININGKEMIDSYRNIKNVGTINTEGSITASGNVNGTNITASGGLEGNSLIVTGIPNIDSKGNIDVNSVKVNGSPRIDHTGNITGATVTSNGKLSGTFLNIGPLNGNVAAKVDINGNITTNGSIKTTANNVETERITNSGIMIPSALSLRKILNCAASTNTGTGVTIVSTNSSDNVEFGCNLPSYVTDKRTCIFLVLIYIEVKENNTTVDFKCDHSGLLTAPTNDSQGTIIFDIYTGDGANVGNVWGQVRVSYQPYSMATKFTGCYLSYKTSSTFNGTVKVTAKLYPIATFN